MAYRSEDDDDAFLDAWSQRSKIPKTNLENSTLEVIEGSFSDLKPIRESQVLAQSTPIHRMEILSGNTSTTSAPAVENVGAVSETMKLVRNFTKTISSRRSNDMQRELNESKHHFGSIRDKVSDVLEEHDKQYRKRIRSLQEEVEAFRESVRQIEVLVDDKLKSIARMKKQREDYKKLSKLILERLPSELKFLQNIKCIFFLL